MSIIKVALDLTNRNNGNYDALAALTRRFRDDHNCVIEETDYRMTVVGRDFDALQYASEALQYDYPIAYIGKV
jgi:hypothetical protein